MIGATVANQGENTMGLFGPSKPDIEMLKANRDVPALLEALNYGGTGSKAADIRAAAAQALGEIGDPQAVETLVSMARKLDEAAVKLHMAVNMEVVQAKLSGRAPVPSRSTKEAFEASRKVLEAIIVALAKIGDPRAVGVLISTLYDESRPVREIAAEALGEMGDPRAIEPLIEVRDDEDFPNDNVAAALGKLGAPPAAKS
jgi:HEAT repeat protein